MSFVDGFVKVSGFREGLAEAGAETIKDALKLKGLRDSISNLKITHKGRYSDLIKTP